MKFCGGCGGRLNRCAQCGFDPAGFRFGAWASVGGAVRAPAPPPSPAPAAPVEDESEGERRQLTVMFCDLADYTALSGALDPEELRRSIRGFQQLCAHIIESYGGYVAQFLGDGLLVYFGYPVAHEDEARRALGAALEIVAALEDGGCEISSASGRREAVRIGVHTGLVVTGEIGAGDRRERIALGQTPNIAARLQALAEPGQVLISKQTQRLIGDAFDLEALGLKSLKGVADPVEVYLVRRPRQSDHFQEVEEPAQPLVGRGDEVAQLRRLWSKATAGDGQIVMLVGEAGVGQSRLMQAFRHQLADSRHHFLWARAFAYGEASMLSPVIEMLERTFRFERADAPQVRAAKLEASLNAYGLAPQHALPYLAELLSLPPLPDYPLPELTPQLRKQRTMQAVVELIAAMAREQPMLFVLEDLHWIDPSTLELLDLLVAQSPTQPMLTFLTTRPQFAPPWGSRSYLTRVTLSRLGEQEVAKLIERVTGGKGLPPEVVEQIVAKTDGVRYSSKPKPCSSPGSSKPTTATCCGVGGRNPATLRNR